MLVQSAPLSSLLPSAGSLPPPVATPGPAVSGLPSLRNAQVVPPEASQLQEALVALPSSTQSLSHMGLQPTAPEPRLAIGDGGAAGGAAGDGFAMAETTFGSVEPAPIQPPPATPVISAPKMQRISPEQVLSHLKQIHGLEARPNAGLIERAGVWLKTAFTNTTGLQASLKALANSYQQAQAAIPARRALAINDSMLRGLAKAATLDDAKRIFGDATQASAHLKNPTTAFASQFLLTGADHWNAQLLDILKDAQSPLAALLELPGAAAELRQSIAAGLPAAFVKNDQGEDVLSFQGEQYQFAAKLGEGGFGKAMLYRSQSSSAELVVKVPNENASLENVANEYALHHAMAATGSHPNLLGLRGLVAEADTLEKTPNAPTICIISDLAKNGTLPKVLSRIQNSPALDGADKNFLVKKLMFDLMQGASRMHENGFVHFDIKPDNILVHEGVALLADFGNVKTSAQIKQEDTFSTGTYTHMAPEVYGNVASWSTEKADVWSLGITAYNMLKDGTTALPARMPVFDEVARPASLMEPEPMNMVAMRGQAMPRNEARVGINRGYQQGNVQSLDTPAVVNAQTPLELLVNRMLATNPADRPSMQEVLSDEVFRVLKGADGKVSDAATLEAKTLFDKVFNPAPPPPPSSV